MISTAWKFLKYDKPKSMGALAGMVMSVFLIGQQCGIFLFVTTAMATLVKNNVDYIWVVDWQTNNANALYYIDSRLGPTLESIPGVESAYPLFVSQASAHFQNGMNAYAFIVGVDAVHLTGGPWNIYQGKKEMLKQEQAVFTEYFDRVLYGGLELNEFFELNGHQVQNIGFTKGIRGFAGGSYVFTTIERAHEISGVDMHKVSAYLVSVKNPEDKDRIITYINKNFGYVKAWKAEDLAWTTVQTILKTSGIAYSFGMLILFAFIVGSVIIGLTLYSSTMDRVKDYGTLKAIGANNRYITRLILTQALLLCIVGFMLGTGLMEFFRWGIAHKGIFFHYPLWLRGVFFLITVFTALLGSFFPIRLITKLEPAQVFRSV